MNSDAFHENSRIAGDLRIAHPHPIESFCWVRRANRTITCPCRRSAHNYLFLFTAKGFGRSSQPCVYATTHNRTKQRNYA